jgi:hypothetical protein
LLEEGEDEEEAETEQEEAERAADAVPTVDAPPIAVSSIHNGRYVAALHEGVKITVPIISRIAGDDKDFAEDFTSFKLPFPGDPKVYMLNGFTGDIGCLTHH